LENLPLTANGKLDRRALPAPDSEAYARQEYEAPQGELEESLAQIWQQLLSVERVGRHDNFFALGGHSLLAVQFLERLRRDLPSTLPLTVLFEKPTIRELSDYMSEHRQSRFDALLSRVTEMSEDEVVSLLEAKKLRANSEAS
jgi:aryl carrier-like protein